MKPIAIITGAASGIGYALAKKCLQREMRVLMLDINEEAIHQAKDTLSRFGPVDAFCIDIADESQIKSFTENILTTTGVPEFIFNNAGMGGEMTPVWLQNTETFKRVMGVNFYGAFYLTKAFLPAMLEAKIRGTIVNTASMASFYSAPLISSYVVSKHGIMAFSECLYHDLAALKANIQVAVVCPGGVKTTILDADLKIIEQHKEKMRHLDENSSRFIIKFAKLIKKGMDPDVAADIIFKGLAENQFYIFTHPEMLSVVEDRLRAVINLKAPQSLVL